MTHQVEPGSINAIKVLDNENILTLPTHSQRIGILSLLSAELKRLLLTRIHYYS